MEVQGSRLLRLDLEVAPERRPAYGMTRAELVPRDAIPRVTPGASLAVHIERDDPEDLVVDWDGA